MRLTKAQSQSLAKFYKRLDAPAFTFLQFRRKAAPIFGGGGAVVVPWASMWIAIEPDGYAHS